jgi:hypothetical protein
MKHEKGVHHFSDHGTKSPHTRQDNYAMKYTGAHGSAATGGPWKESPAQGGRAKSGVDVGASIKGSNKVAP